MDNYLDCVSTFNSQSALDSFQIIRRKTLGTSRCPIAQSSSYYAEFYTIGIPTNKTFVTHVLQASLTSQTYFVVCQRSDRQWVRAKLFIAADQCPETTSLIDRRFPAPLGSNHCATHWLEQVWKGIREATQKTNVRVSLELNSGERQETV